MGKHARARGLFKTQHDTGQAFLEADDELEIAWRQVKITREWKALLDSLPPEQRNFLLHPEDAHVENKESK